jgi:hypothetical protein
MRFCARQSRDRLLGVLEECAQARQPGNGVVFWRRVCVSRARACNEAGPRIEPGPDQKPLTFNRPPVATLPFKEAVGTLAEKMALLIVE